jgi:hypothetical protein
MVDFQLRSDAVFPFGRGNGVNRGKSGEFADPFETIQEYVPFPHDLAVIRNVLPIAPSAVSI